MGTKGRKQVDLPAERDEASLPPYLLIVNTVSERIASGTYKPGSRLPSESKFCAEFGVSPMTLRRALTVLIEQGLVYAEKGRGTFVRSVRLADSTYKLEVLDGRWLDELPDVRLLEVSTTRATDHVARMLRVGPGDRVVQMRRLVLKEGIPAIYRTEYMVFDARKPLVESQLQLTSMHGLLESERGQRFPRGQVVLRAVALSAEDAAVLEESPGAPAIYLEHTFEDAERRPVSWGWYLLRAHLFQLRAQVGPE